MEQMGYFVLSSDLSLTFKYFWMTGVFIKSKFICRLLSILWESIISCKILQTYIIMDNTSDEGDLDKKKAAPAILQYCNNPIHGIKRVLRSPSNLGPPSNSELQGPPFYHSILHIVPWNSPNSEIDEGHIWVGSTIQTNRKQNTSKKEDFKD